ncbi:MAG: hypothetical protein DCC67_11140 [Planctomycetota bacterium]|nr:MAG: hypothetical protein DCC67_11140 [Planctomycetota bacterium]
MSPLPYLRVGLGLSIAVALAPGRLLQAQEPQPAAPAGDAVHVLEQGPIHEAFAEPVALEPGEPLVVAKAPPEPVNELPPDVRPEGHNVEWIPGYWMWSDQQQDFIWVSGVWRDIPPGRRWVPGHWTKAEGGYTWTPGFWAGVQVEQVEVLPLPPDSLEAGPSSPAPGDNYFWIPGCWIYRNTAYVWRPGYWYAGQANWLWVPDHYCYTPYGAIFVNGYWDYPLASRGLLYAPVWWSQPIYARPGYFYRPYSLVNTALLLTALFIHSDHHHYYYGYGGWRHDFYRPWWSFGYGGRWNVYDPFFAYHRWHDGHNRHDWVDRVERDFHRHQDHFAQHRGPSGEGRPGGPGAGRGNRGTDLVRTVSEVRRDNDLPVALRDVTPSEKEVVRQRVENFQRMQDARRQALARLSQDRSGRPGDSRPGDIGRDRATAGANIAGADGPPGPRLDGPRNQGATGGLAVDQPGSRPGPRTAFRLPPVERADGNAAAIAGRPGGADRSASGRARGDGRVVLPQGQTTDGVRPNVQPLRRGEFVEGSQAQGRARVVVPGADAASGPDRSAVDFGRPQTARPQFRPGASDSTTDPSGAAARARQLNPPTVQSGPPAWRSGGELRGYRIPPGAEFRGGRMSPPDGGQRTIQVPSAVQPRVGPPSDGASRAIRVPQGGEPRGFRLPSGGGQPSFRAMPQGGGQGNVRSFPGGGRPEMRGSFDRGGGGGEGRGGGGGRGRNRD